MGIIVSKYKEGFLKRYEKEEGIPYYSASDFPGLVCEKGSFINAAGIEIKYFFYYYDGYDKDRLILFCPGMGPGHSAYFAEINTICKAGFRLLTLDYTGCGESGGERMFSVNSPAGDTLELLALLKPDVRVIPVGHSLGGYTALTVTNMTPRIDRAVIISGFVDISDEMIGFVKLRPLANIIKRFEKRNRPDLAKADNRKYLKNTADRILWLHSTDDHMVNYKHNAGYAGGCGNPNVRVVTFENKSHLPHYTKESLDTMYSWIGQFNRKVAAKELVTLEQKKDYFANKPIADMTGQDPEVFKMIFDFIKEE